MRVEDNEYQSQGKMYIIGADDQWSGNSNRIHICRNFPIPNEEPRSVSSVEEWREKYLGKDEEFDVDRIPMYFVKINDRTAIGVSDEAMRELFLAFLAIRQEYVEAGVISET